MMKGEQDGERLLWPQKKRTLSSLGGHGTQFVRVHRKHLLEPGKKRLDYVLRNRRNNGWITASNRHNQKLRK